MQKVLLIARIVKRRKLLNNAGFLQRSESTALFNCLESFHRDGRYDRLTELGDVDAALLEIGRAADLTGRVKLRRAGTIRIPPAHLR